MRIFLAGASGAIGKFLVPLLVAAGHEVTGTTRSPAKFGALAALGARPVALDALDRAGVAAAVRAARPEVIIHMLTDLAGLDYGANTRLRQEGPRNLVEAAKAAGVTRMIGESISWVYAPGNGPASEDQPLDLEAPLPRGRSVAAVHTAEQAAAELPLGVSLRFGIFYGPGTWYARDGRTTDEIRRGEVEATDAVTSFIHVADAADAVLAALGWPAGVYNIVDDEPAPGTEWVPYYAQLVGGPAPKVNHTAQPWERGESNAKARGLGWRARHATWREGFKEVLG